MSEWKNKLESHEGLSSQPLDKGKAWDKLYNRLEEKPRRKNLMIYWIAAAACLLFGFLLIRFINNSEIDLKPNDTISKQVQPANKMEEERQMINPSIQEIPQSTVVRKSVIAIKKQDVPVIDRKEELIEQVIAIQKDTAVKTFDIAINNPEQKPVTTTLVQSTKKSLKVVHINELGQQVREDEIMAQRQSSGGIYFKLGNSSNTLSNGPGALPASNNHSRIVFNPTN